MTNTHLLLLRLRAISQTVIHIIHNDKQSRETLIAAMERLVDAQTNKEKVH